MISSRTAALAGLAALTLVTPAMGQCEINEFFLSPAVQGAELGHTAAIQGSLAAVGSRRDNIAGNKAGSVTPLELAGGVWTSGTPLVGSDTDATDAFGSALALDGDTLAVGAYLHDHQGVPQGAVYVYRWANGVWSEEAEILTTQLFPSGIQFGWSVDLSGDVLVASSGQEAWVEVFRRTGSNWSHEETIVDPDANVADLFGRAVQIDDDLLLVADIQSSSPAGGIVHAFQRIASVWTHVQSFQSPEIEANDSFGWGLSLDGNEALIPAYLADAGQGEAFTFLWDGAAWLPQQRLAANDGVPGDYFGYSSDLDGDDAIIGAKRAPWNGDKAGAAYHFRRTTAWQELSRIVSDSGVGGAEYGNSVGLSDLSILVGSPLSNTGQTDSGKATLIAAEARWTDLGYALAGTNGDPILVGDGSLHAGCPMSIQLSSARLFAPSTLVFGITQLVFPFKGGTLVPTPTWFLPLFSDGLGQANIGLVWPGGVPPGLTISFQFWISDNAGPAGFAASNGLSVVTP